MKTLHAGEVSVFFTEGKIKSLFSAFDLKKYEQHFVITDSNTFRDCYPLLRPVLPKNHVVIQIKAGEKNKNLRSCEQIWKCLEQHHAQRNSLLITLGGGMVGDLGGFAASVFKRGIPFIHIPTTLLAMADSCIGGKTGINFQKFKNHIGTFTQAKSVFIHTPFMNTLSERERMSGMAEIVKMALIGKLKLWNFLSENEFHLAGVTEELLFDSLSMKSEIVERDFKESGERKILNFGHTIAHAIETVYLKKNKKILHGEAVAAGIIAESYLSTSHCEFSFNHSILIERVIKNNFNLPVLQKSDETALMRAMQGDKKNALGKIRFTLLHEIGLPCIDQSPSEKKIKASLKFLFS